MWNIEYKTFTDVDNLSLCLSHNLQQSLACIHMGFPGGSDGKESACSERDPDSIPGSGRSPGYPLQYSSIRNSRDRGAWRAAVHCSLGVGQDWKTNTHTHTCECIHLCTYSIYEKYLSIWVYWMNELGRHKQKIDKNFPWEITMLLLEERRFK